MAKHLSRPWMLLRFRSRISEMRSANSVFQASVTCSVLSGLSISSMELTLKTSSATAAGTAVPSSMCMWARIATTHQLSGAPKCQRSYLKDVSSLRFPPLSSSSDPALLVHLLAARDDGVEFGLEETGDAFLDCAFRDTVLPLSSACRRKSCMMGVARKGRKIEKMNMRRR